MSSHPVLKGSIRFGLVNIQVMFYAATEDQPLEFQILHKKCHTRIRYQRYCPICEGEVPQEAIVRSYSIGQKRHVILEEEDFEKVEETLLRVLEILHFVSLSEVDPIYFDRAYYVVPDPLSAKAYALLRDAMKIAGKVAIGHIAIHEKGRIALLRPLEHAILLETLHYADAVRPADSLSKELPGGIEQKSEEMQMAVDLMNRWSVTFQPDQYKDTYPEQILHIIRPKVEGKEMAISKRPEAPVLDLREALKASLRRPRAKGKEKQNIA